ncbi:MAG: hypothetical protein GF329_12990 [Candidatus Lokiarchaeota archaeon]|nr:hypothetical protein [Candidatus Lokiarchaeota archaeon]
MVKLFGKKIRRILEKFNEGDIILVSKWANFFGQKSKGSKQVRGNGVLVLTKEELFFQMFLPKRILKVSINDIIDVKKESHHLRKTKYIDLLKVEFIIENGEEDSVAWWVKKLEDWITKIDVLIK